jgi:Ca2+/Na+ antiporter
MKHIKRVILAAITLSVIFILLLSYFKLPFILSLLLFVYTVVLTIFIVYLYLLNHKKYRNWKEKSPFYVYAVFLGLYLNQILINRPEISNQNSILLFIISLICSVLIIKLTLFLLRGKLEN